MADYQCPFCDHEIYHCRLDAPGKDWNGLPCFPPDEHERECGMCHNKFTVKLTTKTYYTFEIVANI